MSIGPTTSYTLSYVVTALFGENWRTPFLLMGIILFCAVVLYFISVTLINKLGDATIVSVNNSSKESLENNENPLIKFSSKKSVFVFYVCSIIAGFMLTSVYFMLNTNVDFFLKEVGEFTNSQYKSLTIVSTILTVIGPLATVSLCEKYKNYLVVGGILLSISLVLILTLALTFEYNIIFSLVMFICFLVIFNGARTLSLSIVGVKQRSNIDSGTYITSVNIFASLSSGLAPKLISMILDSQTIPTILSWRITFLIATGAILLLSSFALISGYAIDRKNKCRN